ncbi:unnamed protein product, partial [Rotaria magnacalcarata]
NLCISSASSAMTYTTSPTTYQQQMYTYNVVSIGMNRLEFDFKAKTPTKTWHLDDISIIDTNASNSEMLINGKFENGVLIGWKVFCSSLNCGGTGGTITQLSCRNGSYCYNGACAGVYDFLRQSFSVAVKHVYVLSFWLYTNGHAAEAA